MEPIPQDLIYAKDIAQQVEHLLSPQPPWAHEYLTDYLDALKSIIGAFEDAIRAEAQGDPILIDSDVLPHGLDYNWLRKAANVIMGHIRAREASWRPPPRPREKLTPEETAIQEAAKVEFVKNNLRKELYFAMDVVAQAEADSKAPWWSDLMAAELKEMKDLVEMYLDLSVALAGFGPITIATPLTLPHGPDFHGLELRAKAFQDDMKARVPVWEREDADQRRAALVTSGSTDDQGYSRDPLFCFITRSGTEKWLSKYASIAKGAWSEVFRCQMWESEERQTFVAFKELRHRTLDHFTETERMVQMRERMEWELNIWNLFDHPNIALLLGHVTVPRPGLVSRWYEKGTISQYLADNPDVDRLTLVQGCAKGLAYLHSKNVIHGDIRESNILIDVWGNPAISDFGHAVCLESEHPQSPEHRAPSEYRYLARERAASTNENTASKESDVYSFGCLMLYIMTRHHPFRVIKTNEEVYWSLLQSNPPSMPGCPNDYPELAASSPLWSLMTECWDVAGDKRPSILFISGALEKMAEESALPVVSGSSDHQQV